MSFIWRWAMESPSMREKEMDHRVAEMSVSSQKLADEYARPERTIYAEIHEPRTFAGPMRGAISADLKHVAHGSLSSYTSAMYYAEQGQKRRDELLAQLEAEKQMAAEEQ